MHAQFHASMGFALQPGRADVCYASTRTAFETQEK
jgi:hypothetical protein